MRTLHADLLAAQLENSRAPAVKVEIQNQVQTLLRHNFVELDATANANGTHDVAVDGNNNVHRVWMNGGNVKYERATSPGTHTWSSWSNLVVGMGAQCAIAASGARVFVVYTNAAGTGIRYRESTDYGATFSADALLLTAVAAVQDLSVAYKNASGDLLVAWITTANLYINKRTGGAFAGAVTWTHGALVAALHSVGVTFAFDYEIALSGTTVTTLKPTLWTLVYGDGVNAALNTWTNLSAQLQADNGSGVTFLHIFLRFIDSYRMTFVENLAITGGLARTYRTQLHPSASFIAGAFTWRTPQPTDTYLSPNGLAFAATPSAVNGWHYESGNRVVRRADRDQVLQDVSEDVLALDIYETLDDERGYIDLNNDAGQYSAAPPPYELGNRVLVHLGYQTASGERTALLPDFCITATEHRRTGGSSVLRLYIEGGYRVLARNFQRTSIVLSGSSYRTIITGILSRAGYRLGIGAASARSAAITPPWTIPAQRSGREALLAALDYIADRLRFDTGGFADLIEPTDGDASVYDYGDGGHPVQLVRLRNEQPPISEARAFGAAAYGEAFDLPHAEYGLGRPREIRDLHSVTGTTAANTAAAFLRQRIMREDNGELVVQPNVGQQLLDVVTLTDAYVHILTIPRRVVGIRWVYDAQRPATRYEQHLELAPV